MDGFHSLRAASPMPGTVWSWVVGVGPPYNLRGSTEEQDGLGAIAIDWWVGKAVSCGTHFCWLLNGALRPMLYGVRPS